MFGKKKQITAVPADAGQASATSAGIAPVAKTTEMGKELKLPGPKDIPEPIGNYLVRELKWQPIDVWELKAVLLPRADSETTFDFRVYNEGHLMGKKVKIKNHTSFDDFPELVLFEGWFDKKSGKVHIERKPD